MRSPNDFNEQAADTPRPSAGRVGTGRVMDPSRYNAYPEEDAKPEYIQREVDKVNALPELKCTNAWCSWSTTSARLFKEHGTTCAANHEEFLRREETKDVTKADVVAIVKSTVTPILQDFMKELKEALVPKKEEPRAGDPGSDSGAPRGA